MKLTRWFLLAALSCVHAGVITGTPCSSHPPKITHAPASDHHGEKSQHPHTHTKHRLQTTFTGVISTARTSATTCYALPTPLQSLEQLSVAAVNWTNATIEALYMADNYTTMKYVEMRGNSTASGNYILYLSTPDKFGMVDSLGNTFLVDTTGFHIATPHCGVVIDILIPNFPQQADTIAANLNSTKTHRRSLKRWVEHDFKVNLTLTDQCRQKVTDLTPMVSVGETQCTLVPASYTTGSSAWICQFPGENSREMKCENALNHVLSPLTSGFTGQATNWESVLKTLGILEILNMGKNALGAWLADGLGFALGATVIDGIVLGITIDIAAMAVLQVGLEGYRVLSHDRGLYQDLCMLKVGLKEFPLLVAVDFQNVPDVPSITLASLVDPPASDIDATRQIEDPNVICGGVPATPSSFTDDMWTFMTLPDDALNSRHYMSNPATLYAIDPSLLLVNSNGDIEANTKCINLDAPATKGPLMFTNDVFYFGWDSAARSDHNVIGDTCTFRVFAGDHCEPDGAYHATYVGVQRLKLPFNVRSWQVSGCEHLFKLGNRALVEKSGWKFTFDNSDEVSAWSPSSYFVPFVFGGALSVNTRCLTVAEASAGGVDTIIPRNSEIIWETHLDPVPPMLADDCCILLSTGTSCQTNGGVTFWENCVGFNGGSPIDVKSFKVYGCTGRYVPLVN